MDRVSELSELSELSIVEMHKNATRPNQPGSLSPSGGTNSHSRTPTPTSGADVPSAMAQPWPTQTLACQAETWRSPLGHQWAAEPAHAPRA